jgi:hypothetical protein
MQALTPEYEVWSSHSTKSGTADVQYMITHLISMHTKLISLIIFLSTQGDIYERAKIFQSLQFNYVSKHS